MVHYQRYQYHQLKKSQEAALQEDEDCCSSSSSLFKKTKPKLLSLLLLSLLSCSLILAPSFFNSLPTFSLLSSSGEENEASGSNSTICSSITNGSICCDRSGHRSDICIMRGDIRTQSSSFSIMLYNSRNSLGLEQEEELEKEIQHEKIRPYTRKWETSVMNTIDEVSLISKNQKPGFQHLCDVFHDVPAVFFSTGGYTGNVYHEFNDGIIPLYITSQHFNKKVVFVILEYHDWWITKYEDIISQLSDYPPIDFHGDPRTHCFSESIVGLRIHDELTVDSSLMKRNKSIVDFRNVLDRAYFPRIRGLIQDEKRVSPSITPTKKRFVPKKPKLVVLSRNVSRAITNEYEMVKMAKEIGFEVEVVRPGPDMELAKLYRTLNSSDVMIGVHGAAMTHFMFLKPGSVFIQVVPLGTKWAAETYYGEPAKKLGLKYMGYEILKRESSLYDAYDKDDPILKDPESVTQKGWEFTKKIYLDGQNVRLDLLRFRKRLVRAYGYSIPKKNRVSRRRLYRVL